MFLASESARLTTSCQLSLSRPGVHAISLEKMLLAMPMILLMVLSLGWSLLARPRTACGPVVMNLLKLLHALATSTEHCSGGGSGVAIAAGEAG